MILVIIRTLILYTTTVILLRIMGKRQIGQLQPYELVVIIMISELAAVPMQNTGIPLINGVIPIVILVAAEITLSYISLKSESARGVICGKPSILIERSKIVETELTRLRYNINDLLEQLRSKNVTDIADVEYAILETSGQLSVILKSEKRPVQPQDLNIAPEYENLPVTLIIDGQIIEQNLSKMNIDLNWVHNELVKSGVPSLNQVLFATLDSHGKLYYQVKSNPEEQSKGAKRV
ncbi:MAG: DUF421 domain-containing protein [Syntrophomonas sp.]